MCVCVCVVWYGSVLVEVWLVHLVTTHNTEYRPVLVTSSHRGPGEVWEGREAEVWEVREAMDALL